jgi:hypothetical protein
MPKHPDSNRTIVAKKRAIELRAIRKAKVALHTPSK